MREFNKRFTEILNELIFQNDSSFEKYEEILGTYNELGIAGISLENLIFLKRFINMDQRIEFITIVINNSEILNSLNNLIKLINSLGQEELNKIPFNFSKVIKYGQDIGHLLLGIRDAVTKDALINVIMPKVGHMITSPHDLQYILSTLNDTQKNYFMKSFGLYSLKVLATDAFTLGFMIKIFRTTKNHDYVPLLLSGFGLNLLAHNLREDNGTSQNLVHVLRELNLGQKKVVLETIKPYLTLYIKSHQDLELVQGILDTNLQAWLHGVMVPKLPVLDNKAVRPR